MHDALPFTLKYYPVYLLEIPNLAGEISRSLYVETKSHHLGRHNGYKFPAGSLATATRGLSDQDRIHPITCSKPGDSKPNATLKKIGYVLRKSFDEMMEIREGIPWTGEQPGQNLSRSSSTRSAQPQGSARSEMRIHQGTRRNPDGTI